MPGTRSRVRGDKGFRKVLKQLPDAARDEMKEVLTGVGAELATAMRADVPTRTGALRSGIAYKVSPKTLNLKVGLIGTKRGRAKLFYGWIVELGRKAQTVTVTRKRNVAPYRLRVKGRAPHPFVFKRRDDLRSELRGKLQNYWNNVLAAAGNGASFDD